MSIPRNAHYNSINHGCHLAFPLSACSLRKASPVVHTGCSSNLFPSAGVQKDCYPVLAITKKVVLDTRSSLWVDCRVILHCTITLPSHILCTKRNSTSGMNLLLLVSTLGTTLRKKDSTTRGTTNEGGDANPKT